MGRARGRAPDPDVGAARTLRPARRRRRRRAVPRIRPLRVRHGYDRARRRRYVRRRRMVPDGGGRMDQPAAPTLSTIETARAPASANGRAPVGEREAWYRRLWREYVTAVRAAADAHASTPPATDPKVAICF